MLRKHLGECCVLLKSNGDFPLKEAGKIAAYGSGVRKTIKGGTGSGEVKQGLFVVLDNDVAIRVDRIITLFGKPGAAYDEYNAYGNACMDCTGGYDPEELK